MEVTELRDERVMDRNVYQVERLPDGFKCNDITEDFVPAKEKSMHGLKYIGTEQHPGSCGMHRDIMKAVRARKKGFLVLAIDRAWKELLYVRL